MELTESPAGQHSGGIFNYFQGATIHNLVINGNMSRSGTEYYHAASTTENTKQDYTDEQIAQAIEAINGKGKAIDSKQKWAGVYWYLLWACNYPLRTQEFCERIGRLPFDGELEFACDYRNIRELTSLSFMGQDARQLDSVKPSRSDEVAFMQCRSVVIALEQELQRLRDFA